MKNRKQQQEEYQNKYKGIPIDNQDRISYMVDKFNISDSKMDEILNKRDEMLNSLFFYECTVVQLLEEPEGTHRPRFRILNKSNFTAQAKMSQFVHVYTPKAGEDHRYMEELCSTDMSYVESLINTPCVVQYNAFYKTPASFNVTDTFLAEIGLIRPTISKPDWDNLGKKYSDMYNHNVWADDALVYDAHVSKYYSILPRVEIHLKYINAIYNKYQYNSIIKRKDYDGSPLSYLDKYGRIINNND